MAAAFNDPSLSLLLSLVFVYAGARASGRLFLCGRRCCHRGAPGQGGRPRAMERARPAAAGWAPSARWDIFFLLARPWILAFVLDRIALSVASRRGGDGDGDGVGGPEAESDVLGPARMGRRD